MNTTLTKSVKEQRRKRAEKVLAESPYTKIKTVKARLEYLDRMHGRGSGATAQRKRLALKKAEPTAL